MQKATTLPTAYPLLQLSLPFCIHSIGFQWHLESCTKYPLCYSSLSDSASQYRSKVLWIYTSLRQLCSSSDSHILCVLSVKIKTFGQRSFSYAGSVIWNKLPYYIRISQSKTSFTQALKIHLLCMNYWISRRVVVSATHVAAQVYDDNIFCIPLSSFCVNFNQCSLLLSTMSWWTSEYAWGDWTSQITNGWALTLRNWKTLLSPKSSKQQ